MFKWKEGRQGTGYKVLTLWFSKRLKRDCHVIKYETGAYIPPHTDPAPEGFVHRRINIVFSFGIKGGEFVVTGVTGTKRIEKPKFGLSTLLRYDGSTAFKFEVFKFKPSEEEHQVYELKQGSRFVLSFGKLEPIQRFVLG